MTKYRLLCHAAACSLLTASAAAQQPAPEIVRLVAESGIQGGLIVHVGCDDLAWTGRLPGGERFLIQGLCRDDDRVERARQDLRERGRMGPVTVRHHSGSRLPYADNLVSLSIVEEGQAPSGEEILRVLSPQGVAFTRHGGDWQRLRKPWPEAIDEWTHYLHGPSNNAVAADTRVGPPHHVQWTAGPRWGRSHDQLASVSAAVSSAGRLFFIVDEGSVAAVREPSKWMLVARNAFNGVLLWKKPMGPWEDRMRPFRSGPADLPRRLVAVENRVYVTPGYGQPIRVLDAATGRLLATFDETAMAQEIVVADGKVYAVVGDPPETQPGSPVPKLPEWLIPYPQTVRTFPPRQVLCLDAETGKLIWRRKDEETTHLLPLTMAISGGRVFFHNEKNLVALQAQTGKTLWNVPRPISLHRYAWSVPTLVVHDEIVLSGDRTSNEEMDLGGDGRREPRWLVSSGHDLFGGEIIAFSAASGERLWSVPCHENFNAPVDVFVARGQVWSGQLAWPDQPGIEQVYDLHTGEVTATRPPDSKFGKFGHHRCYRAKATTNYVLHSRRGIEFVDMDSDRLLVDPWVRGVCQFGVLPCNGMIYVPPHACACLATHQLSSFNALAARSGLDDRAPQSQPRLVEGPAYSDAGDSESKTPGDWPTYRGDASRSGATSERISPELAVGWQRKLGGRLTPPVIAAGRLFVAQPRTHTLFALDAASGGQLWSYSAGAPIDSPPTISQGRAYFGSADGWVYCLGAADGRLAWRRRAAPGAHQVVSYDRLESAWPLHGNLLVCPGEPGRRTVYGVAGRSTYLDGGMVLFGLDAETGRLVCRERLFCPSPDHATPPPVDDDSHRINVLPDVLSTDGSHLFMRGQAFDLDAKPTSRKIPHLFSSTGFLDDTWWHRTYWQYGVDISSGYGAWINAPNRRVSGRILVSSEKRILGYGRKDYFKTGSHLGMDGEYHLFAANRPKRVSPVAGRREAAENQDHVRYEWSVDLPFHARALALSGDHLLAAGPEEIADVDASAPASDAWLRIVSAGDGRELAEYPLASSPVFDGLAITSGRVFLTTVDGQVTCYRAETD